MAKLTKTTLGFTAHTGGPGAKCTGIILEDSAGHHYAIWVANTGSVRVAGVNVIENPAFNPDTDGISVGGQPTMAAMEAKADVKAEVKKDVVVAKAIKKE